MKLIKYAFYNPVAVIILLWMCVYSPIIGGDNIHQSAPTLPKAQIDTQFNSVVNDENFVIIPAQFSEPEAPNGSDGKFSLNLQDTDVNSLIKTVSFATGKNFVVDPRVVGQVTVISATPVSADELYEQFLAVLQVHGFAAVPAGGLIKIVPDFAASQGPVPVLGSPQTSDQLVTQVIPILNTSAAQLVQILGPMVPQEAQLAADPGSNSLVITDRASNIQRLIDIINLVDVSDNEEVDLIQLNHASAADIVNTLSPLQDSFNDGAPGGMQLLPDARTNSVLVTGSIAARTRASKLISKLDSPVTSGGNTRVVFLHFADADEMAAILAGLPSSTGGSSASINSPQEYFDETYDGESDEGYQQEYFPPAFGEPSGGSSNVQIKADENTNSLIISAPPSEMTRILAIIQQLDIRRPQVLVEAVIAEVTEDNIRELGINFLLDGSDSSGPVGYTNLGGGTASVVNSLNATGASGLPTPDSGVSLALGSFANSSIDFGLLFRAIASDADNNILSTPTIVTLDNEEAEIVVGSNVPFITGQQLSGNNDNPFQTIEREDIGLRLKVKPQINEGDTIKLELEQEVSNVNSTSLVGAADITTSKRLITTTVLVEDGQTLVLGGLIDDQVNEVTEKVPLLGDIPGVGRLFQYKSRTKSKKNLMIFLHPVIMRDSDVASRISGAKYNQIRAQRQMDQQAKNDRQGQSKLPEIDLKLNSRQPRPVPKPVHVPEPVRQSTGAFSDPNSQNLEWVEMPDGTSVLRSR